MDVEESDAKPVEIDFVVSPDLRTEFANQFVVQHQPEGFFLSFFDLAPPIILGDPEERAAQIERTKSVKAYCKVRLFLTPNDMRKLVGVLTANLENFEMKMARSDIPKEEL